MRRISVLTLEQSLETPKALALSFRPILFGRGLDAALLRLRLGPSAWTKIPRRALFIFLCLASALFMILPRALSEEEAPLQVVARGAILMEAASGRVLYEDNVDEMLPIASTTKILTCLLALENASLGETVRASANASGTTGTSIYLSPGEALTMEEMLYGLMLRSGNDAAVAIAEHVSGSVDDFATLMNERAAQLGADAHFVNPHGLDAAGHAASARAMALIMRSAIQNETFMRIATTKRKVIPWPGNAYSRLLQNKNRLLTSYEGALAGKTGFTDRAGRCLVFTAERNEMLLVGALLNCSAWFDTAEALLDYGYEAYTMEFFYEEGAVVETLDVAGGQARSVNLVADSALAFPIGIGENYEISIEVPDFARAPVRRGAVAGRAAVSIKGVEIASVDLLYEKDVPVNNMEAALKRVIGAWVLY